MGALAGRGNGPSPIPGGEGMMKGYIEVTIQVPKELKEEISKKSQEMVNAFQVLMKNTEWLENVVRQFTGDGGNDER